MNPSHTVPDPTLADEEPTDVIGVDDLARAAGLEQFGGGDGTLAPAPERAEPELAPMEIHRGSPWLAPLLATFALAMVMTSVLGVAVGWWLRSL